MANLLTVETFIFPANSLYSNKVDKYTAQGAMQPAMIYMPEEWEGGDIRILTSADGVIYQQTDDGTASATFVTIPVVQGGNYPIDPSVFYGARYYQLVATSTQSSEVRVQVAFRAV